MGIKRFWDFKIDELNQDLVYRYIDENDQVKTGTEPLKVLGQRNPRLDAVIEGVKKTMDEVAEMKRVQAEQNQATKHTQYFDEDEYGLNYANELSNESSTEDIDKIPVVIPEDAEDEIDTEENSLYVKEIAKKLFKKEELRNLFEDMQNARFAYEATPDENVVEKMDARNLWAEKKEEFEDELENIGSFSERRRYSKFVAKEAAKSEPDALEGEEIADEQEKQEATYEDVEPSKKKKWLKRASYAALVAIVAIAIAVGVKSCSKEKVAAPVAPTTTTQTTIDDLKADSRYTEITEAMLIDTTEDFVKELADHGITVTSSDALTYVTLANITHLQETNPKLLTKVFEGKDSVETLSKTGHIIGQIVTNEVTTKDDTIDWTIALMDETDRKIAAHGAGYVVEGAKKIAADTTLKEEEKVAQIQALVENKFVAPNFDKTVGYTFNDGSKITLSQEDGADFVSDAIITGILMGDNTLKNYINAENKYKDTKDSTWVTTTSYGEVSADLKAISENTDSVSNLMRMLEGCQTLDANEASISENKSK